MGMQVCRACARHFRCGEASCPFCAAAADGNACGASLSQRLTLSGAMMLGAIVVTGCPSYGGPVPLPIPSVSSSPVQLQPVYGAAVPSALPSTTPSPSVTP